MKVFLIIITLITSGLITQSCDSKKNNRTFKTISQIQQYSGDIVFGDDNATNTIYLFASYHCKYCRFFFSKTYPELKQFFLDKGNIKLVVKLVEFSDNQQILYSLQAASCIYQFGAYEKFHELLRINPNVIFTDEFRKLVNDIMDDNDKIAECILSNSDFNYINENVKQFRDNDLSGTPCLILNNHAYSGFMSYNDLRQLILSEFKL